MKKVGQSLVYSPSDLINFMENEFITWMDRYHLEFPGEVSPEDDRGEIQIFQRLGQEHEAKVLQQFRDAKKSLMEIVRNESAVQQTLEAISRGTDIVYQAALQHERFAGYSDFLIRKEQGYEVWDTKLARKSKPYFVIQLCCYAEMLEAIQGRRPESIGIILGDGRETPFRTDDYFFYYQSLKRAFLEQQDSFNLANRPTPMGKGRNGRWETAARNWQTGNDHLRLVAGISTVQIQRLESNRIRKVQSLAECTHERIPKMLDATYRKLRHQAQLQVQSRISSAPLFEVLPADPEDPRKGLALLPPHSPMDVVLDMEGFPLIDGQLEYLSGVTYLEHGELKFKDWWAHNALEEKQAFESVMDWICERRKADPAMHVYHYAPYEEAAFQRLMGTYGTRELEMDDLLRNEVLIDLYKVVRQGVRIGTENYSLKTIESLYRGKRETEITGGGESMVFYERWLTAQEGKTWQTSAILKEIREYNRDDCTSAWQLKEWLRDQQTKNKIAYFPPPAPRKQSTETEADMTSVLAGKLRASIPADRSSDPERWRVQELIAQLLEFHRREDRPMWWTIFNRLEMTEEELFDDKDCLSRLVRTARPPEPIQRSLLFEYNFDPDQDTTIHQGSTCVLSRDLNLKVEIAAFDGDRGLIGLKISPAALARFPGGVMPGRLSLTPFEYVPADAIVSSIERIASGTLPRALDDFLYRHRPRFKDKRDGSVLLPGTDIVVGSIDAAVNMDQTTLCIQGPPGAGKTFTAACMIVELLERGKRAGISANSHKAICNLMAEVAKQAAKRGVTFSGAKIKDADGLEQCPHIEPIDSIKDVQPHHALVGGTAWAFSAIEAIGRFDYLFVDEAGQVSIANLTGMSPSTKNIVLIGDQMQLSQPTQGAHPGDSGRSTLDYYFNGIATIPDDRGIFLSTTWRMRPEICQFISEAIYEGRLKSEPVASKRCITLPTPAPTLVRKSEGLLFIPVEHEGNSQASEEEAAAIQELIRELQECEYINEKGELNRISLNDILVVAPYNMQVRLLKRMLGPAARIGTIDKFQGQEAVAAIISMCASAPDASPRGLDFLLDKNRLNVAISRAKCLAIIVGHPSLGRGRCTTLRQMSFSNLFCRAVTETS